MNSYNTIINELISQKELLDQKGFNVNTANTYPSPSEITEAIRSINFDLSNSTATEADVLEGKTFYSQTNELKTGTLSMGSSSNLNEYLTYLISGRGQTEIIIPETATQIRPYAFATYTPGADASIFSHENFTIPSNIQTIYQYAFYQTNLNGTLTIPSTVQDIYNRAFYATQITNCVISGNLSKNSTEIIGQCSKLKKITITEPVTALYKKNLGSLKTGVEEIVLPTTLTSIESGTFSQSSAPYTIRFLGATPPTITTSVFSDIPGTMLIVDLSLYSTYYNATNYLANGNPMFGVSNFNAGDSLPSTVDGLAITWHNNIWDAMYALNPFTQCPADGEMYAVFTK